MILKLWDCSQSNFWFEKKVCSGLKQGKQSKPWLKSLKHIQHRQNLTNTKITKSQNNLIEASQPDTIRTKSAIQIRCMFQSFFILCTPECCAYSHSGYRISLDSFSLFKLQLCTICEPACINPFNQAVEAAKGQIWYIQLSRLIKQCSSKC